MIPQILEPEPLSGEALRSHVRTWLENNLLRDMRSDCAEFEQPSLEKSKAWEAAMHQAGLTGVTWPVKYGGQGRTLAEHLIVSQEIGRMPMPESVNSIGKELTGPIIQAIATEEQKLRFLPAILEMRDIWCQGFSEPEAGSDLAGLRTKAVCDGNTWRINGQKIWTSGALRAQRCLLLARTGVVEDRHRGLALFAVKLDTPGVRVRPIRSIDGKEGFCEVFFDNVEVDQSDALGAPDEGWSAAIKVLSIERATNRMHRAWRFEGELRHLVAACKADGALNNLLSGDHVRRRLAETLVDIEVLKGHVENAVSTLLAGRPIGSSGSLPKLHWSEAHQRFAALAIEMLSNPSLPLGEAVRIARRRFQAVYLQARAETIFAGTTEIQLGIIADRILELPKGR